MIIERLSSELKNTVSLEGKVGLVLLATDQITLYEFEQIFKNRKILFFPSRVMSPTQIIPDELIKIKSELAQSVRTILPQVPLDVVAFSCTSATMAIGEAQVEKVIKESDDREIKAVINPFTAIKNACSSKEIRELGLITPYVDEVTHGIMSGLKQAGIETLKAASFNLSNDNLVPEITLESIIRAVKQMAQNERIKTIFISCTNLNVCSSIHQLESLTGKTILTSNQVMAWNILRSLPRQKPIHGFGRLLEEIG